MLPFFNQKELVVCSNQSQYQKYTSLLEKEGIGYRTKVRDLSSPSLFSMGTRERTGTTFQKVNYQMLYTIYVRKADYERAVHVYHCLIKPPKPYTLFLAKQSVAKQV